MRIGAILALLLLMAGCQTTTAVTEKQTDKRPNILWIYVEDMNDWMGAFGDDTVPTPNIDKLAGEGVRFDQVIMPAPVCSAVRSAIITGDMQTTLGTHNHRSSRFDYNQIKLPQGHKTLPELFQESGYETFNIGKDDYNFSYDRKQLYSLHPGPKVGHQGTQDGPDFDWGKSLATSGKPFFGQIQLRGGKYKVKNPPVKVDRASVTLPPYYNDQPLTRDAWARHYENIHLTDLDVGKIMAELKNNGLLENTVVFFFTDHGMGLLRHKQFLYDGGLQVPLVVSWQGGNDKLRALGAERKEQIRGLDIGGSSLGLAGIDIPSYMTTENFFATDYQPKPWIVSARDRCDYTFDKIRSVRTEEFKYIRNYYPERPYMQPQYRDKWPLVKEYKKAYASGQFNAVESQLMADSKPAEELYDLKNDPHEIHNLATVPAYENQLVSMRGILNNWVTDTDDKALYPESDAGIREVLEFYKDKCQSPECRGYRARHPLTSSKH
ncbi:sulfatase [Shewanella sp. D64]|uniref:sulfatase family protein n=1 Tax=unclassified Shewanella TaxID=196818 RepID=UPI0022BA4B68|nr:MULTISPECIES: sulfatase [unclassified Shewanella]MEC4724578.1 sulfatase [Shewanella sp. D64]MEC4736645.1 sulfatase [Shewanella sp. E94]WBJ94683.1 sulfatase [Shewanella sp. MTB7]